MLLVVEVGWIAGARGLLGVGRNAEALEDAAGLAHLAVRHFAASNNSKEPYPERACRRLASRSPGANFAPS